MEDILVYPAGSGESILYAGYYLERSRIATVDHPTPEVTHLLLDVPTGTVPVGLLERVPEKVMVVGGNLKVPELSDHRKLDLLQNEGYLAKNAAITAECALRVAAREMKTVFSGMRVLVIGWGRIGKCLSSLLKNIGCSVTIGARKVSDRAMAEALGFSVIDTERLSAPDPFGLIFNTAPAPVLDEKQLSKCPGTLKIDLASRPGLAGRDVICARGLPGKYAPESSGKLIAETLLKEVRQ